MDKAYGPLARESDLIVEEIGDEVLVYDSRAQRGHCLSPEAAQVWRRCDGRTPTAGLSAQLDLDVDTVKRALDELHGCDLLEDQAELGDGTTRRELTVKMAKVGGAVAAAPLILSVGAPVAHAAVTPAFCAQFSSGNCGGNSGCSSSVGCCCCTPPLHSPYDPGSPCDTFDPTASQCKTCVPTDIQVTECAFWGHTGNGCSAVG